MRGSKCKILYGKMHNFPQTPPNNEEGTSSPQTPPLSVEKGFICFLIHPQLAKPG